MIEEWTLEDTKEMMGSKDYKERFRAEYAQAWIRYEKLFGMVSRLNSNLYLADDDMKTNCPIFILERQLNAMNEYLFSLRERASIEGIDLTFTKENK